MVAALPERYWSRGRHPDLYRLTFFPYHTRVIRFFYARSNLAPRGLSRMDGLGKDFIVVPPAASYNNFRYS